MVRYQNSNKSTQALNYLYHVTRTIFCAFPRSIRLIHTHTHTSQGEEGILEQSPDSGSTTHGCLSNYIHSDN